MKTFTKEFEADHLPAAIIADSMTTVVPALANGNYRLTSSR